MRQYVVRRLVLLIPTVLGVTLVVFAAVRFLPGDAIDQMYGEAGVASPELRAELEERYSLDGSVGRQYLVWLGQIARGDFGTSINSRRPVSDDLRQRIPVTLQMGLMGLAVSIVIALPVGTISAVRQDTLLDYLSRSIAVAFLAVPSFWLAMMALTYGFIWFNWTPPLNYQQLWESPVDNLKIMIVPALILGASLSGTVMRMMRSMMLEVMREDYTRTARAKGLAPTTVIMRHALRNALIPVITIIGVQVSVIVGGTVILEQVFSIPGMGTLLLSSINVRDYPVVQAIVLLTALVVVVSNFIVDVAYTLVDPRIRVS